MSETLLLALLFPLWCIISIGFGLDAETRGRNGPIWAVLVFIFGLAAILIYLILVLIDE